MGPGSAAHREGAALHPGHGVSAERPTMIDAKTAVVHVTRVPQ